MKYIFAPFVSIKNSRPPPRKQTAQRGPDCSHKIYSGSPLVLTETISTSFQQRPKYKDQLWEHSRENTTKLGNVCLPFDSEGSKIGFLMNIEEICNIIIMNTKISF